MIIVNNTFSLAYIKCSHISVLERWQNLRNPWTYLELCQTSKIECFVKTVKD